jgi:uncharacterized protein (DUF608 family)/HEAT repeat protein
MEKENGLYTLIEILKKTEDEKIQWNITNELIHIGKDAVRTILKELETLDDNNRRAAMVYVLAKISDRRAVTALLKILEEDGWEETRMWAAYALETIKDSTVVKRLVEIFKNERSNAVRDKLLRTIVKLEKKPDKLTKAIGIAVIEFYKKNLGGEKELPDFFRKTIVRLGRYAEKELKMMMRNKNKDVSETGLLLYIDYLGNKGDREAIDFLIKSLKNRLYHVRYAGIENLSKIYDRLKLSERKKRQIEKATIEATKDKEINIKIRAIGMLGQIGGKRAIKRISEMYIEEEKKKPSLYTIKYHLKWDIKKAIKKLNLSDRAQILKYIKKGLSNEKISINILKSKKENNLLQQLSFKNSGIIRKDMRFEYRKTPCFYMEGIDKWVVFKNYSYLYERRAGKLITPPSGMRSSVPLGGLGAGTIELRADGSFHDWNIFNNSPVGGGKKVQLNDAFFGLGVKTKENPVRTWILRTHPPRPLPGIEQIEYAGAYPVSRLRFTDRHLPVNVTLYAYSEFCVRNASRSAAPAIMFSFMLKNPSDQPLETWLMFNLPNHIGGNFSLKKGLTLTKKGKSPTGGTMAVWAEGKNISLSAMQTDSLLDAQKKFTTLDEHMSTAKKSKKNSRYGTLAARTTLAPKESKLVTFVLSWHFPYRLHNAEVVGNYYTNIYTDADDVTKKVSGRLPEIQKNILEWQQFCFNNTLPKWLQDAMVNSIGTLSKTGIWVGDGRWRHWESFSCHQMEPIEVLLYRRLPYSWFLPSLTRSPIRAFALSQKQDGYIKETLGHINTKLDTGIGRMKGDNATVFILEIYRDYLWTGDKKYLDQLWPRVKRAAQWQIKRCKKYGLPNNLLNTYDLWDLEKKDIVAYNAFFHISAMLAAEKLAVIQGDKKFEADCSNSVKSARKALYKYLWTDKYFRCWWNKDGNFPDVLHTDTLCGELWANILNLNSTADLDKMTSHLSEENKKSKSPFGLKIMWGMPKHPKGKIIIEAGTLDWTVLNIYLGGNANKSLAEAEKIFYKWRVQLRDQWDIRDGTLSSDGLPWCNSHYSRQLIFWAIPLVLSGQQYSAPEGALSFDPKVSAPAKLPFMTPTAHGILELKKNGDCNLTIFSGKLDLRKPVWNRSNGKKIKVLK